MSVITAISAQNKKFLSNYPFDASSTLKIDNHTFPATLIKSLKLQVHQAIFPLHIGSIEILQNKAVITIFDAQQSRIAYAECSIDSTKCFFKNNYGLSCGSMVYDPQLVDFLYGLPNTAYGGSIQLSSDTLILDIQTISCVAFNGIINVNINGVDMGNKVNINFHEPFKLTKVQNEIAFSVTGQIDYSYKDAIKLQKVNNVDLKGKSLLVRAQMLSDLRVNTAQGELNLTGVRDA